MNCEDCFHYEACNQTNLEEAGFPLPITSIKYCEIFKDKSKIVELPCNVGDRVYVICIRRYAEPYIRVETVLQMTYLHGNSLALWQIHTEYAAYNAKDVFYTKEQAEARLKELQNG